MLLWEQSIGTSDRAARILPPSAAVPRLTPSYPLDPALIHASGGPRPSDAPPLVFGGVLRGDSPFLDVAPAAPLSAPLPASDSARDEAGDDPDDGDGEAADDVALDAMVYMPLIAVAPEPPEPEPAGPPQPFDREAVERARARAARPRERVEATVWTDDGVAEHVCDVSAWLAGATGRELEALASAGWTGDDAAEVAAALAEDDPEIADVLRHARRADAGVVVDIDGRAALAWLARHRPATAAALDEGDADEE